MKVKKESQQISCAQVSPEKAEQTEKATEEEMECSQKEYLNETDSPNRDSSYTGPSELELMAAELETEKKKPVKQRCAGNMDGDTGSKTVGGEELNMPSQTEMVMPSQTESKRKRKKKKQPEQVSDGTTTDTTSPQQKKTKRVTKSASDIKEAKDSQQNDIIVNLNSLMKGFRKEQDKWRKSWEAKAMKERQQMVTEVKDTMAETITEGIKEFVKENMKGAIHDAVQKAVELTQKNSEKAIKKEIQEESKKCIEAVGKVQEKIEGLERTVTEVERSTGFAHDAIEAVKKTMAATETKLEGKIKDLNQNFNSHKTSKRQVEETTRKEHQKLVFRVTELEKNKEDASRRVTQLEGKVNDDEFPIDRTVVAKFLVQDAQKTSQEVAETFVHHILKLPEIPVMKAKKMGQLDEDSKGTLKILLKSAQDQKTVLQSKRILGEYTGEMGDDINGIYLRQSKTTAQLMLENHTNVLVKVLGLESKVKTMPNGRLMRVRGRNNNYQNNFRGAPNNRVRTGDRNANRSGGVQRYSQGEEDENYHHHDERNYQHTRGSREFRGRRGNRARGAGRNRSWKNQWESRNYYTTEFDPTEHTERGGYGNRYRNRGGNRRQRGRNRGNRSYNQHRKTPYDSPYHPQNQQYQRMSEEGEDDVFSATGEKHWNNERQNSDIVENWNIPETSMDLDQNTMEVDQIQEEQISTHAAPFSATVSSNTGARPGNNPGSSPHSRPSKAAHQARQTSPGRTGPSFSSPSPKGAHYARQTSPVQTGPPPKSSPRQGVRHAGQVSPSQSAIISRYSPQPNQQRERARSEMNNFPPLPSKGLSARDVMTDTSREVLQMFKARRNTEFKPFRRQSEEQMAHRSAVREQRTVEQYRNRQTGFTRNQARVFPEDSRIAQQMEREKNGMGKKSVVIANSQIPHCSKNDSSMGQTGE